ncbi:o-succinylbenzoate synthase [Stackebrandtia nassauensis]|uniref:o-succinylbenzoate synthase n=1 Tax=Stackebrandtia nassauensis (strain DSM 44728 / CIP 108903 / NRRL B-16338 / NBRC 102104 / LLR-40K-21) TaxID=446470 RepID=D3PYQ5_STANL|nr:o-succinylbenzoate synthase [Stackebrandtia nassauensis]ADD43488.1 o-succinylbenzoate synthase [Stackebrandtia nassauensis DSM 44728]
MRITGARLHRVHMPLVAPFRTSFGTETVREFVLLRLETDNGVGWGECVADATPLYSSEYLDAANQVMAEFLLPRLADRDTITAPQVAEALSGFKGHPMAKSCVEMAVLDAGLRSCGMSFADYLGGVHATVPVGVSVGIMDSIHELLDAVDGYLKDGYRRVKLKIEPGWDVEPVREVRERFGDDVDLQVDANAAYRLSDARQLARLDDFDLLLLEQPLAADDLRGHAELAWRLTTPICLDESITSARSAADAIALGAASMVNIKPGRVGGYLEARRVHDVCAANGVGVWCGGMLETGLGRAANLALAGLPGFVLPGDISASTRYYARDITEPFELEDGCLRVPTGPGLGVEPIGEALAEFSVSTQWIDFKG